MVNPAIAMKGSFNNLIEWKDVIRVIKRRGTENREGDEEHKWKRGRI